MRVDVDPAGRHQLSSRIDLTRRALHGEARPDGDLNIPVQRVRAIRWPRPEPGAAAAAGAAPLRRPGSRSAATHNTHVAKEGQLCVGVLFCGTGGTRTMFSPSIATSPVNAGAPVPSMMLALRITSVAVTMVGRGFDIVWRWPNQAFRLPAPASFILGN